jgi:hypothetical protein
MGTGIHHTGFVTKYLGICRKINCATFYCFLVNFQADFTRKPVNQILCEVLTQYMVNGFTSPEDGRTAVKSCL